MTEEKIFHSIDEVKREFFPSQYNPKIKGDCKMCLAQRRLRDYHEAINLFSVKHDDAGECGECIATRMMESIRDELGVQQ